MMREILDEMTIKLFNFEGELDNLDMSINDITRSNKMLSGIKRPTDVKKDVVLLEAGIMFGKSFFKSKKEIKASIRKFQFELWLLIKQYGYEEHFTNPETMLIETGAFILVPKRLIVNVQGGADD